MACLARQYLASACSNSVHSGPSTNLPDAQTRLMAASTSPSIVAYCRDISIRGTLSGTDGGVDAVAFFEVIGRLPWLTKDARLAASGEHKPGGGKTLEACRV